MTMLWLYFLLHLFLGFFVGFMGYYLYRLPESHKISLTYKINLSKTIFKNLILYIITMVALVLIAKYIWWSGKQANVSDSSNILSTILMFLSVPLGIYSSKNIFNYKKG